MRARLAMLARLAPPDSLAHEVQWEIRVAKARPWLAHRDALALLVPPVNGANLVRPGCKAARRLVYPVRLALPALQALKAPLVLPDPKVRPAFSHAGPPIVTSGSMRTRSSFAIPTGTSWQRLQST